MSGFQVTPLAAFATQNDEGFPDFLTWQQDGTNLGSDATVDTVNVVGSIVATRGTGESANVVTLTGPDIPDPTPPFVWREVFADTTLELDDLNGGIATMGTSGDQNVTLPGDDVAFLDGASVLIFQEGAAAVNILVPSGVELLFRDDVFLPSSAGPGATLTVTKRRANTWILCGDMATS